MLLISHQKGVHRMNLKTYFQVIAILLSIYASAQTNVQTDTNSILCAKLRTLAKNECSNDLDCYTLTLSKYVDRMNSDRGYDPYAEDLFCNY
jgi:hypothetical protein